MRRHSDKDIRKAIKLALDAGWTLEEGKGHRFGTLRCGDGCEVAVWEHAAQPDHPRQANPRDSPALPARDGRIGTETT